MAGPKNYNFASADALVPIVGAELLRAALSIPLAFLQQESGFVLVAVASLVPGRNMLVAPDGRWGAISRPSCEAIRSVYCQDPASEQVVTIVAARRHRLLAADLRQCHSPPLS